MTAKNRKQLRLFFSALPVLFLFSCATVPRYLPADPVRVYAATPDGTLLARYAPVFIIENPQAEYNRIGTPRARINKKGKEKIQVDPRTASVYTRITTFKTAKGRYTNLFYRLHFKEIPGGFFPFYLGKGKNTGLLVVVTLNQRNEPILYTSVHTCGCYLAFVPTSYMQADCLPDGWRKKRQTVYSESLPGMLEYAGSSPAKNKTLITIRAGGHRVKNICLAAEYPARLPSAFKLGLQPFDALEKLSLTGGRTTSFYETAGARKGYVKGSQKIRERLLMSWWALDWRVGEDKKFGKNKQDGILFYTSLKPWARKKSDMRDFKDFLIYWKWTL